jgi:hypothetical protein
MNDLAENQAKWLVFVDKAADDGELLRLMVLNPFNGVVSTFIHTPIDADPRLFLPEPAPIMTASEG